MAQARAYGAINKAKRDPSLLLPGEIVLPILLLLFLEIEAKKPPGYVEAPEEIDPDPPKYEYGYKIKDQKAEQGKDERREGQFSQGSYYVKDSEDGTDSKKNIKYFTDDWGFHTIAEYSNQGPNSKSSVTFIQDQEALKYRNNGNIIPDLDPNNNAKTMEDDPSNQKPSLPQPVLPTQPTTPLLSQEQIIIDPNQVNIQPNEGEQLPNAVEDPPKEDILVNNPPQEFRVALEDPNRLQYFYIEPNGFQQTVPSALEDQYTQLQHILLQGEILPAPQPLVYNHEPSLGISNDINIPTATADQVLYHTSIVHNNDVKPSYLIETSTLVPPKMDNFVDFNTKNVPLSSKLIESTKDLVTGTDVIKINESVESEEFETSTLNSLLQHYVTPSLSKEMTHVEINNLGDGFSTTLAPILDNAASLLHQPIVVAEETPNPSEKPVVDENQLLEGSSHTTAQSTLKTETPTDILVTPRPSSTNFLAPITAGLHMEQVMQDTKIVEQQNKENVVVTVQKSVPHYLGKYEYPTAYAGAYNGQNFSDYVKEDLELGTTLLHFSEAPPHAEKLVQELPKTEQQQIFSDITNNHLNHKILSQAQFYPQQSIENNFLNFQVIEKIVEKPVPHPQPYPVEKNVETPVQIPVEITKFVDRPVEVKVPYPQPYPVEKIVEKPVPIPVSYPIQSKKVYNNKHYSHVKNHWHEQKKHDVYVFQVPKKLFEPNNKQHKYWNQGRKNVLYTNHYAGNYAPQIKNYLPTKQSTQNIDRGYLPIKTINNLELEHFPRENIHNLPPITKNPGDTHYKEFLPPISQTWNTGFKNQGTLSNYIPVSNVNVATNNGYHKPLSNNYGASSEDYLIPPPKSNNNGYFPPQNHQEEIHHLEQQASFKNYFQIKPAATEPLGLVPPKSSGLRYPPDLAPSPSEPQKVGNVRYHQYQALPLLSPSGPSINQMFRGGQHQYENLHDSKKSGGVRYDDNGGGRRSPRSHYFDESSVRMEYGFMPPFKPSQKIREVLEVNPE